jgi:putative peptide zinc metalloprotease protein
LFQMEDPLLMTRKQVLESHLAELNASFKSQLRDDPGQAQITRSKYNTVASQLERAKEQAQGQKISSPLEGTLLIADQNAMLGRFYRQGDLLAYVAEYPVDKVMAVVQQDYIGQVRQNIERVELRFASDVERVWPVTILREIPASTLQLPSSALGDKAGGRIQTDPASQDPTQAFEPFFQFELSLPEGANARYIGERVYLRFDHGKETLAVQLWRSSRRAFLKRFSI